MSKKKETLTLSDAMNRILYPSADEAAIALEIFEHWIRTKFEIIWARDFAALARVEWPMEFYNYGWPVNTLWKELFNGNIYVQRDIVRNCFSIKVSEPVLISEEVTAKEENK